MLWRALNKQKASPACGRAEANSRELVVRVSSAFQREWATTAFVVRLVRSGRWDKHKSQKGGKTLPGLAGDGDAARDQVIHATGRLTSALRAAC